MVWHDEPSEIDAETAEAYWDHVRLLASTSPEDREAGMQLNWACEDVTEALAFGDARSVDALVTLSANAESPAQLEHLGAVLLPETLEGHDARLLDALAESIGRTPRLRASLAFVTWDSLSDDATERLHPLAVDANGEPMLPELIDGQPRPLERKDKARIVTSRRLRFDWTSPEES